MTHFCDRAKEAERQAANKAAKEAKKAEEASKPEGEDDKDEEGGGKNKKKKGKGGDKDAPKVSGKIAALQVWFQIVLHTHMSLLWVKLQCVSTTAASRSHMLLFGGSLWFACKQKQSGMSFAPMPFCAGSNWCA